MKQRAGYTLIEVVLVTLVMGVIVWFVGSVLVQETKMFSLIIPRKEAKIEGKLVMERLMKDLRYAYRNEFTTGSNVRFKMPLDAFKGYSTVSLYLTGGNLLLKTGSSPEAVIAERVSYFNITSVAANYANYTSRLNTRNLVNIKLTVTKDGNDIAQETTVYLRGRRQ